MSNIKRPQPDPGEVYAQAFEALDSVVEDRHDIDDTFHLLEAECKNDGDATTLFEMYQEELANLDPRVKYTLSKLGELTVSATEQFSYIREYASTLPEEMREMAEQRALWYVSLLNRYLRAGGAGEDEFRGKVPTDGLFFGKKEPSAEWPGIEWINGRKDSDTGRYWINMCDPRTVQVKGGESTKTDRIVASYEIVERDDSFVTVKLPAGDGVQIIKFNGQPNDQFRLSENGKRLELYIPRNTMSLSEVFSGPEPEEINLSLPSIQAAGGHQNPIWDKFRPAKSNPVPVNVAKRN